MVYYSRVINNKLRLILKRFKTFTVVKANKPVLDCSLSLKTSYN